MVHLRSLGQAASAGSTPEGMQELAVHEDVDKELPATGTVRPAIKTGIDMITVVAR